MESVLIISTGSYSTHEIHAIFPGECAEILNKWIDDKNLRVESVWKDDGITPNGKSGCEVWDEYFDRCRAICVELGLPSHTEAPELKIAYLKSLGYKEITYEEDND